MRGNKFLQLRPREVQCEISPKITLHRIITVQEDNFTLELFPIPQMLSLDSANLRVKFV